MNKNFIALNNEAHFIRSTLGIGMTEIGKANYATLGVYWQAFTNLSVGLERLAKLTLLLDLLIDKEGIFPTNQELKKYGHDLIKLYNKSQSIITNRELNLKSIHNLDEEVHSNILSILNNFAKGDRYANLDFLTGNADIINPVSEWASRVDDWIWNNDISRKKQENIYKNAARIEKIASPSVVIYISESNDIIDNMYDASLLVGKWQAVVPYRKLYLVQIIRYWIEILKELENICHKCKIEIPFFHDYFSLFFTSNEYIKKRKNWIRLY